MNSPSEKFTMHQEETSPGVGDDGDALTWQPMREPSEGFEMHQEELKASPRLTQEAPAPPPVCIPAEILDVFADPFSNPFNLGDSINCAADVIGTAPFTYEWNGGAGSGATFSIVVSDGNIEGKDETGLGHITVTLLLKNACNEAGDFVSGTFAAQGAPPP